MLAHLVVESALLAALLGAVPADPGPERKTAGGEEREKAALPELKTPQAKEKLEEAMGKIEVRDYIAARSLLTACLKDAASAKDRKALQGLIDDTKLGAEIEAARKLAEGKKEKKAIAKVESAIKKSPESSLVPAARKFIAETEELIFCILDDFEPGDTLQEETAGRNPGGEAEKRPPGYGSRWRSEMSFNSDPAFVFHGKGSMKWEVGGRSAARGRRGQPGPGGGSSGYRSLSLKTSLTGTRWRFLVFYVFLPEATEGTLQATLSPAADTAIDESLYTQKLIDLRGKAGWLPVALDITRDFANTRNVKLEDIRFVRIDYNHVNRRTIYLDFVHLE